MKTITSALKLNNYPLYKIKQITNQVVNRVDSENGPQINQASQ